MRVERRTQIGMRLVALVYLAALLAVPVGLIFYRTFEHGWTQFWDSITTPAAIHAFWLTIEIALIAVPLNTVFGVIAALALVRGDFRGKWLIEAIIDIPFAVSPIVIGLSLILVYGSGGWLGSWFEIYGTWETLGAQLLAGAFVIGSYFLAQHVKVTRPARRGEQPAVRTEAPPAEPALA